MDVLIFLIPIALTMGLVGLAAFLWSLKSGQYEDLDGAAQRILIDDGDRPLPDRKPGHAAAEAGEDEDGPQSVQKS